jgi:hypothetical protein
MPALPFPKSSTPGVLPGEGEGRLINAYLAKQGGTESVRRVSGSTYFGAAGASGCRGLIDVRDTVSPITPGIYGAWSGNVYRINDAGVATSIGALAGTGFVSWAKNNRTTSGSLTPDLIACRAQGGAYVVSDAGVIAHLDTDLPTTVNSVDFLGGFHLYTNPDGRMFASDLNSLSQQALAFATAESRSDGLVRGIVFANTFYAFGTRSIEPWLNVGSTPFPLRRATTTIAQGLITAAAIAGQEEGWGGNPLFVSSGATVEELVGFETRRVSTPAVERFLALSLTADPTASTFEAAVYVAAGERFWAISTSLGTWEYNTGTRLWHERVTTGYARWSGSKSVLANGRWHHGTTDSGYLKTFSATTQTEGHPSSPLAITSTIESGPLKDYPTRSAIGPLFAEFTKAAGTVSMQASIDGGSTWTTARTAALANAEKRPIQFNRMGMSGHHGLRVRFSIRRRRGLRLPRRQHPGA